MPDPDLTYTLDAMERPTALSQNYPNNYTWASGATYNAANQPLHDGTATRAYNSLNQMTSIAASGMSMTYNYSSTNNNGQITSSKNNVTNETVTYQYDALKRLVEADGLKWGETYTYDGYGNLTQMNPSGTAGAPSLSLTVALDANNVPTNRINASGVTYDNNGNQTLGFGNLSLTYDAANRISAVGGIQTAAYAYDSDNRRIYSRNANGIEAMYFYGVDGKTLATYTYAIVTSNGSPEVQLMQQSDNVYFLGKLIAAEGNAVQTDRLGSVRSGGPGNLGYQAQYPYGVEYSLTANDREKYATYTRDSATGLDYAMNRYYASQWGRFLSPDPYAGSVSLRNPQSWNRYGYVGGDPANHTDPSGLYIGMGPDGPEGPDGPGFGDGSGCGDGILDPLDPGNWFDGGWGPPTFPFGGPPASCGQGFLPSGFGGAGGGGGSNRSALYKLDAAALAADASQFASDLLNDMISADCAGDMADLGITPEDWAGALENVSVLNGIGSQVPLASTLPNGSAAQQFAQSKGMTVGQTFSAGSGQVAMASVNGPQVWINPFLVNPGDTQADAALIGHETLHNLGLTDATIQHDLGLPVTNNTVNISNKLQQDCFPGPPGIILQGGTN
jgi:RHS repeat-associated protein